MGLRNSFYTGTVVSLGYRATNMTVTILLLTNPFGRIVSAKLMHRYHALRMLNSRHEFLGPQPRRM